MLMKNKLENIIQRHREKNGNIISLLQETQAAFGFVPKEAVVFFSEKLGIAPSRFYGIATFYSQFRLQPTGRHKITACCGTACHVRGAEKIIRSLKRELELPEGEDTTADGEFTLDEVACLGTCSFAPVVLVNGDVLGRANPQKVTREIRSLRKKNGG
jgi:NADH:ubiquinone oxidoreductase subunit E